MSILKVPFIPENAIIEIKISGAFYRKIQTILMAKGQEKSKEDFVKVLNKLKTEEPISDIYEAEVQVLTALVVTIEKGATDQNKLEYREIEEPKETN